LALRVQSWIKHEKPMKVSADNPACHKRVVTFIAMPPIV